MRKKEKKRACKCALCPVLAIRLLIAENEQPLLFQPLLASALLVSCHCSTALLLQSKFEADKIDTPRKSIVVSRCLGPVLAIFERNPKENALPERYALLRFLRYTPALRCYPMHFSTHFLYALFGTLAGSFA